MTQNFTVPTKNSTVGDHYAIVADELWDGKSDTTTENLALIVKGQKISAITSPASLESNIPRINLPGCTLMPGLMDAHIHYSAVMGPAFLAAGVTTVRDVGNNLDWILNQRSLNENDMYRGPTILCCGHLQDGPDRYWPRMGRANNNAEAVRQSVREHIEAGVDAIKLYPGLDATMVASGIDEAHRLGKPVTAHLGRCTVEEAVSAGLDCIEHLVGCKTAWLNSTVEADDSLIDLLLERDVTIDPTLVIFDRGARGLDLMFNRDTSREWAHPAHRHYWDSRPPKNDDFKARLRNQQNLLYLKRFLVRANSRGVITAIGTDTPFPRVTPGFSLHDEMGMYVDAGIKPVDVLKSATSINASLLRIDSNVGLLHEGFQADLLAVRGNPISDIRDIQKTELVIRKGLPLNHEKLRKDTEATFDQTPDDAITNDLLDRLKMN